MNENKNAPIDFKEFDADAELEKIRADITKPNIFLCGATGAGKSSLVRDIFNYSLENAPETGDGAPVTRGVHRYEDDNLGVVIHDSEGYEAGEQAQKYYEDNILGYVDECNRSHNINDMDSRIHETWYCVSAGAKKFLDVDISIISKLKSKKIPVCVVLTKVDCISKDNLNDLIAAIKNEFPDMGVFTYSSLPNDDPKKKTLINNGYIQSDKLLHWAYENLDESLRDGLLSSANGALKEKHIHVMKTVIPISAAGAIAAVVSNSFIPVPFSDSIALMGIQSIMALKIINSYNIAGLGQVVGTVVGSTAVSTLGKTAANSLAKAIPGLSQAVAVANSTVAATLTATIGFAVNEMCYRYMDLYMKNKNGEEVPPFAAYFTSGAFKEMVRTVQEQYGDKIKQIADGLLEKAKVMLKGGK